MLTELHLRNFKSWRDTGPVRLAPLTGLFGTNSSGKTALVQALLVLKQTAESADRQRALVTSGSHVDLGTFRDVLFRHADPGALEIAMAWDLPKHLSVRDPESAGNLFQIGGLRFRTRIAGSEAGIATEMFDYLFEQDGAMYRFGMQQAAPAAPNGRSDFDTIAEGYTLKQSVGRPPRLPAPVKCYGFPDQVNAYFQNAGFLSDLVLAFEQRLDHIFYLGPLREYPQRAYVWSGERPGDVGQRGQLAVQALLATHVPGAHRRTVETAVARWLKTLGLVQDFALHKIADHRMEYEVRVRGASRGATVLITDVGFGVSQILPVLVLCYYAPKGAVLIFEQPEIHLHPSVQAGLADVFVEVVKKRGVQIIVESHSEHLLRRLQRLIAEESFRSADSALYFCETDPDGASQIVPLEMDIFGYINNWPEGFLGDEMSDLAAMTDAAMRRRQLQQSQ